MVVGSNLSQRFEDNHLEGRRPLLELHLPVEHDRRGYNDEVRTPSVLLAGQVEEQRYCLKLVSRRLDGLLSGLKVSVILLVTSSSRCSRLAEDRF